MVVVASRARSGSTGTSASEEARCSGGDVEFDDDDGFEMGARLLRTTVRRRRGRRRRRRRRDETRRHECVTDRRRLGRVRARRTITITRWRWVERRRRGDKDEYKVRYESFHFPRRRDEWVSRKVLRAYAGSPRWKSRDRSRVRSKPAAAAGRVPTRRRAERRGENERAKGASSSGDQRRRTGESARSSAGKKTRREPVRGRKERKKTPAPEPEPECEAAPKTLTEDERAKRTIRVSMQASLRKVLLCDYEASRGTDLRPFVAPRVNVVNVLNQFLTSASPPTNKVKAARAEAVVRGFEACFDRSLDANLLYKDEWHNPPVEKPSERYGALHLLRMLAKLPAMFPPESFAEDADALLVQTKANELSKFLASRAREFGVHEVAIDVSLAPSTPDNGE